MTLNATTPPVVETLLQVGELVLEADTNGFILQFWSRDQTRMHEYTHQYDGKTIRQLYGHDAADCIRQTLRQKKTQYFEYVNPINKGSVTVLRFLPISRREDRVFVMVEQQRSRDPDKFLEQRLRQAEEARKLTMNTFANAFMYCAHGMALVNLDGKWFDVNHALCNMTGYTREELLGMRFDQMTHPEDMEADQKLVWRMMDKEIDSYSLEKRLISKSGAVTWVLYTSSLMWAPNDTPGYFIIQVVDISGVKQLTGELNTKNEEQEQMRLTLEDKVARIEEISYMIGHNLRGPAGNIKMIADVLQDLENGNDEDPVFSRPKAVSLIVASSNKLLNNLNTLLDVAKIGLDKDVDYAECDVVQAATDVMTQLSSEIEEKRAVIKIDCLVKHVLCPQHYLVSILYNLISNALKYAAKDMAPQITIMTAKSKNSVMLMVKDNGIGIDLEKHGEKMFKLNQVFHSGYDSKGVGLYMTKTQIESLGGRITVESTPGRGTAFSVFFPTKRKRI